MVDTFLDSETQEPTCPPVSIETSVDKCVQDVLDASLDNKDGLSGDDGCDSGGRGESLDVEQDAVVPAVSNHFSSSRFIDLAKLLERE